MPARFNRIGFGGWAGVWLRVPNVGCIPEGAARWQSRDAVVLKLCLPSHSKLLHP
jgi:hypothetical protein